MFPWRGNNGRCLNSLTQSGGRGSLDGCEHLGLLLQAFQRHFGCRAEIALARLPLIRAVSIPVTRSSAPGFFDDAHLSLLPMKSEGGLLREPAHPLLLVVWMKRLAEVSEQREFIVLLFL